MAKKKPKNKKEALWAEAKRRCRLSAEDIRMAKEMGLNPRSLIKNIPSKSELWKAPVRDWILDMYEKRQAKTARKKACMGHGPDDGEYPKLLITGLPGCGKTTAVRRIVAELDRNRVSGFYTQEIREEGIRRGFQWNSLDGTSGILAHTDINGPWKVSKYGVDVIGFENFILPLLDPKREDVELFVIDEIGKMECLSGKFTEAVRKLFSSNKAILATVAQKGTDLISEVKAYPGVRVFTLKRETHDNTVSEILKLLSFLRAR